jgi:hypothetical protein
MSIIEYPVESLRVSTSSEKARFSLRELFPRSSGASRHKPVPLNDEFSEYELYDTEDWDGYGAEPITKATVDAARAFKRLLPMDIDPPDIAPGGDGTIGFEWRRGSQDSRVHILVDIGPGDVVRGRRIEASGNVQTFSPTRTDTGARSLISLLFS